MRTSHQHVWPWGFKSRSETWSSRGLLIKECLNLHVVKPHTAALQLQRMARKWTPVLRWVVRREQEFSYSGLGCVVLGTPTPNLLPSSRERLMLPSVSY